MSKKSKDAFLEMIQDGSADLETETSRLVALIKATREKLTLEMASGELSSSATIKGLGELGRIIRQATDTQLKLESASSRRASRMTQQDYLEAAMKLILSCDRETQKLWVKELLLKLEVNLAKAEFLG